MTKRHFLGTVAALGLMANGATAQQIINLEEVTFSANLTPTEIARSGSSVTVLTREMLEREGAPQLADLISRTPSVSLTRNGGMGSNATVRIRGAGEQYITIFVDGIRVADPTELRSSFDFGHTNLHDVERVEILRGSQSALYGGNAVAGAINVSTLGAQQDGFSQSSSVEAGSYRTYIGRYSIGFRDDRFEAALNLSRVQTAGFSAYEGPIGSPKNEPDAFRSTRLSLSARYQLAETIAIGLSGFAQDGYSEYDRVNADADNAWKRRERALRGFVEFELGETQNEISISHYDLRRRRLTDNVQLGWFNGNRTELRYQGNLALAGGVDLGWGADWTREEGEFDASLTGKETVDTKGIYGQLQWQPVDSFDMSASVRLDRHSEFGNHVSTRLAASWAMNDTLRLRGAVGNGFAAPSIPQRFGADYSDPPFFFALVGANPFLKPETSVSAELGLDIDLGRTTFSATAFQLNTEDAIVFCAPVAQFSWDTQCPDPSIVPPGANNQYQNFAGTTKRRGLELEASTVLLDQHRLDMGYTKVFARNPDGTRVANVPRHSVNLGIKSEWTEDLSSNLTLQHIAGRTGNMPSYSVVNTSFRYRLTDQADLTLRIDNLFNKQYQSVDGYGTSDRAFYLGLAARF